MPGPPDSGSRRPDWIGIAAVAAVALAASLAGIGNDFAYDDVHVIQYNPRLHGLGHWREILTLPYWPPPWNPENYRPLTSLLLAAQYGLGGGAPVVFRITSYVLYAATAVGMYVLAGKVLAPFGESREQRAGSREQGAGSRERRSPIALGVALLFAAHPVHVEAVAPAFGQSELLVGLCALVMTIRYLDRRRTGDGTLGRGDWAVLGALYVAASLTKEHGLLLPALLLAVEAFLVEGPLRARVRRLWPGYAFLAGLAGGLVLVRLAVLRGQLVGQWTAEALEGLTMGGRALTMLTVVPEWARLLIWPAHLQADYAPQELVASTGFGLVEAFGLLLLAVAAAATWIGRRRAPAVAFGLTWTAITLLPSSNVLLPTASLLAERLLFLPSAGVLLAVGGVLAWLPTILALTPSRRRALQAGCAVLVLAGVARSAERHRVWRNEAFFSVRGVQDAPRSYRMQRGYAEVLFELGQWDLAVEAYRRAVELAPPGHVWRVRNDMARRYRALGRTDLEVEELRRSLTQNPDQEEARGHLIAGYLLLGRYQEAEEEAETALARGVSAPEVFRGLLALADSAARVSAPAGTIRVRIRTGPVER